MNAIVIALFAAACVFGTSLAQDCSAQVKAFHQCLEAQHNQTKAANKPKHDAMKAQADACYTSNGCPVPAPKQGGKGEKKAGKGGASSADGSGAGRKQCREAVHKQAEQEILACVKQANPGVTLPAHDGKKGGEHGYGGHHGGPHGKGGYGSKKNGTCPDKQKQAAVFQCLRKLHNSSAPSEAEKEQQFNAACQAKKTCQVQLSAQCQQQLQAVKKSFCQCAQQQFQPGQQEKLRSGVPACQGVQQYTPKPQGQGQGQGQHKAKSCDEQKPDYCQLGYEQFKADQQKRKAEYQAQHQQANGQEKNNGLLPIAANLNVNAGL